MRRQDAGAALPRSLELARGLGALRPLAIARAMLQQPLSVWSLYLYLFFEYVRPQTIYPWLNIVPWARIALIVAVASALMTELAKRRWTMLDTGLTVYSALLFLSLVTAFDPAYGWGRSTCT